MPARTCTVKLGEVDYVIPALDIDQLQRVTDLYADLGEPPAPKQVSRLPFAVLVIALERCVSPPAPRDPVMPSSLNEVRVAMEKILRLSGLQQSDENPQQAPAAVKAA